MNLSFKLRSDADGAVMEQALDLAYPIVLDAERKAATFHHVGTQWTFQRNHFGGSASGFVFTTTRTGAIASVKYALQLP